LTASRGQLSEGIRDELRMIGRALSADTHSRKREAGKARAG
jgi:hypothetical protein